LKQVTQFHSNINTEGSNKLVAAYKQKYPDAKDDLYFTTHILAIEMLARAMDQAKSTDPAKVGKALEGMKINGPAGEVTMRADNHQLVQPLYISTYSKVDGKEVKNDVERTGNGFKTDRRVEAKDTVQPTTCKMVRPQ
jgi:branched-chain amino acid transport system substrate-binding protein